MAIPEIPFGLPKREAYAEDVPESPEPLASVSSCGFGILTIPSALRRTR